jgi:hypothetical protein
VNKKQVTRVVLLVVLGLGLSGVVYLQFFRLSPKEQEIRDNFAASQAQAAADKAGAPAPAGAPAAVGAPAAPAATSIFKDAVDIDELIISIKTVDFKYEQERIARNTMTPLVGPFAPPEIQAQDDGTPPPKQDSITAQLILAARSMDVSGILWDPNRPMAVVDDEVVSAGYKFANGILVDSIEQNQVILRVKDSLIPLELKEQ